MAGNNNNGKACLEGLCVFKPNENSAASSPNNNLLNNLPSCFTKSDPFFQRYRLVDHIGEGSYSEVIKCVRKDTGAEVACKRLKQPYKSWNQVNDIPEVTTLRMLQRHPNILQMLEIHYDMREGRVSLVFEIMDLNLYEVIKDRKIPLAEKTVRLYMYQLLRALKHLHKFGIFHRDIKPENILIRTRSNVLKLGDLGSVRGIYCQPPFTEYISTRWYRSPECLLTAGHYGFKMDIWAAGCVFYEILTLHPLFAGSSEIDQINRIHTTLGPPPLRVLQKFQKFAEMQRDSVRSRHLQLRWDAMLRVITEFKNSRSRERGNNNNKDSQPKRGLDRKFPSQITASAKDLVKHMLTYDPDIRPSSSRVMSHSYFNDVREFKVPDEDQVKAPLAAVFVNEAGQVQISQYYGHVDLRTIGERRPMQRRVPVQGASNQPPTDRRPARPVKQDKATEPSKKVEPIVEVVKKAVPNVALESVLSVEQEASRSVKQSARKASAKEAPMPNKSLKVAESSILDILAVRGLANDAVKKAESRILPPSKPKPKPPHEVLLSETLAQLRQESQKNKGLTKVTSSTNTRRIAKPAASPIPRKYPEIPREMTELKGIPAAGAPVLSARSLVPRAGTSLPSISNEKKNYDISKPPLPPKLLGPIIKRIEAEEAAAENSSKNNNVAHIVDSITGLYNKAQTDRVEIARKTFGVTRAPDATQRRAERIRAQLRDDTYGSSDDDAVVSIRQKLDQLITERTRRGSQIGFNRMEGARLYDSPKFKSKTLLKGGASSKTNVTQENTPRSSMSLVKFQNNRNRALRNPTTVASKEELDERVFTKELQPSKRTWFN